jgi:hypothetical protein
MTFDLLQSLLRCASEIRAAVDARNQYPFKAALGEMDWREEISELVSEARTWRQRGWVMCTYRAVKIERLLQRA